MQNVLLYDTVMQISSISGADDVPPARRLWNICAVVHEELGMQIHLVQF